MTTEEATPFRLKMRDLSRLTGLDRQTIHFYIKEGILPEGEKTGPNMAVYGQKHLERLTLIKRLQREQFLPLRVISKLFHEGEGDVTVAERALLHEVRARLPLAMGGSGESTETLPVAEAARRFAITVRDVRELAEAGLITLGSDGKSVPLDQLFHLEFYGTLERAGLTRRLGFSPRDLVLIADAMDALFEQERRLLLERLATLDATQIAGVIDRSLPVIGQYLARYHTERAAQFFRTLGAEVESKPKRASRRPAMKKTSSTDRTLKGAPS